MQDLTMTDNFNDTLIVKEMCSVVMLEIYNKDTNTSNEFELTIDTARTLIDRLQDIVNNAECMQDEN